MDKRNIYVLGINEESANTLSKLKEKYNFITTILIDDIMYHKTFNNIDICIYYDFGYNDFKGKGYEGISEDLCDSIKEEIDIISKKINKDDVVFLFNNFVFTGSNDMFYYTCKTLSAKTDNCYILFCNGYSFQGVHRRKFAKETIDKIYKLNYKIIEFNGDEISKTKGAKDITEKINAPFEEFYNYIDNLI